MPPLIVKLTLHASVQRPCEELSEEVDFAGVTPLTPGRFAAAFKSMSGSPSPLGSESEEPAAICGIRSDPWQ